VPGTPWNGAQATRPVRRLRACAAQADSLRHDQFRWPRMATMRGFPAVNN